MPRGKPGPLRVLGRCTLAGTVLLLSVSCAASRKVVETLTANCREIQVGIAHEIMRDNPDSLLLDVRQDGEFPSHLPHLPRAREIPISDLPIRYRELNAWKKQPILVFSRDGLDAASACEFLARQGFPYVSHVSGGVEAWIKGGYGRTAPAR